MMPAHGWLMVSLRFVQVLSVALLLPPQANQASARCQAFLRFCPLQQPSNAGVMRHLGPMAKSSDPECTEPMPSRSGFGWLERALAEEGLNEDAGVAHTRLDRTWYSTSCIRLHSATWYSNGVEKFQASGAWPKRGRQGCCLLVCAPFILMSRFWSSFGAPSRFCWQEHGRVPLDFARNVPFKRWEVQTNQDEQKPDAGISAPDEDLRGDSLVAFSLPLWMSQSSAFSFLQAFLAHTPGTSHSALRLFSTLEARWAIYLKRLRSR